MKSLIRWSTALGLAGGILLSSAFASGMRLLALTTEQVVERLRPVPVFTLADQQGAPLVAMPSEGENKNPVAGVFINRQDAQTFLDNLKSKNPQVAQGVQVVPVSLAQVFQMANQPQGNTAPQNQLHFAFVPARQQVDAAKTLLQQSGQNADQFRGVPLFVAKANGQNGGYLTVKQGDQQVIPMFFNREEMQTLLDRLRQTQPNMASSVSVQVVNLEGLIQTLQSSNNTELNQIMLIPPQESINFVRSLQGSQNRAPQGQAQPPRTQAQPAQPAPSPAPAAPRR
jgi:hypothetical protein